mmetsp:Transcript_24383/g.33590  ORF Transcript_24383/g.33590 Transcript_24383/m.33590 type:complete len:136 (+) Transcript_24383:304-711(+)
MGGALYFVIVSRDDHPIFEADLSSGSKTEDVSHLHQFILHASLDPIDERMWESTSMNLKIVDKFNELHVSAYVTAGRSRLLLLHETRNEEGIKLFFQDVHELYLKVLMNPFHDKNAPLKNVVLEQRIRAIGRKYL